MRLSALRWLHVPGTLLRTYGWRGIGRRCMHELRRNRGWFKPQPCSHDPVSTDQRVIAYCPAGNWRNLPQEQLTRITERGRRVVRGEYQAYGDGWRSLPEAANQWHEHPSTGFVFPMVPWWKVPHLPAGTDIKDVWEPARFGWIYDLVRAFAATGDTAYSCAFHERLAAWQAANPPFHGPQWACGQEVAIRALALLHAEDALPARRGDAAAAERVTNVLRCSAERIADAIGYGLSQRNNHGISESAGLIHLGLRFRGAHAEADRWLRLGARMLDEQICDQFSTDGWYAQHSFTYMRVALEQALYAERAMSAVGSHLSPVALARLDAAIGLLEQLVDTRTGAVPNHGANDGARVLPLSMSEYADFRPLLTLAAMIRHRPLAADLRADADTVRWIGGELPPPAQARADGVMTGSSGWAAVRVSDCSVFLRAGAYRHRPSHLDCLHLDVRIGGKELVTDAGTYAYNAEEPWNNGLASAFVHNGPVLDGEEIAERGPRFLWLSWPTARLVSTQHGPGFARIVAERPGAVRREVLVTPGAVRVRDRPLDRNAHFMQVTWLMHPDVSSDIWVESGSSQRIPAREADVTGWYSPTYGLRRASSAVRIVCRIEGGADGIETTIGLPAGA
jgi:hypothetical protein